MSPPQGSLLGSASKQAHHSQRPAPSQSNRLAPLPWRAHAPPLTLNVLDIYNTNEAGTYADQGGMIMSTVQDTRSRLATLARETSQKFKGAASKAPTAEQASGSASGFGTVVPLPPET